MIPVAFFAGVPGARLIRAFSFGVGALLLLELALTAFLFEARTRNPDGVWHVVGGEDGGQDAVLILRQSSMRQLMTKGAGISYMATSNVTRAAKGSLVLAALLTAATHGVRARCRSSGTTAVPAAETGGWASSHLSSKMKQQEERLRHATSGMAQATVVLFAAVALFAAFDVVPVMRSSALTLRCSKGAPQLPSGRCLPPSGADRVVIQSNLLELAVSNYLPFLFCVLAVFTCNGSRRYALAVTSFAAFSMFLSNVCFSFIPIFTSTKVVVALSNTITSAGVLLPPLRRLLSRRHRERAARDAGAAIVNEFFAGKSKLDDAGLPKSVTRGPEDARDPRAAAAVKERLVAAASRVQRRLDLGAVGGLAWLTLVNTLLTVFNTSAERQVVITITAWMVSNVGVLAAYVAVVTEAHRRLRMSVLNEEIARETRQTEALERRLLLLVSGEAFVPFTALRLRAHQLERTLQSLPDALGPEGAEHAGGDGERGDGQEGPGNTRASGTAAGQDLRPALRSAVAGAKAQWEPLQESVNASVSDIRSLLRDAQRWGAASAASAATPRFLHLRKALFQPADVAREVATAFRPQARARGVSFSLSFAGLLSRAAGRAPEPGEAHRGPQGASNGGAAEGKAAPHSASGQGADAAPSLPRVSGDAIRVRQLVSNLVRVSLQLTPSGGSVHLTVSLLPTAGRASEAGAGRGGSLWHNPLSLLTPEQEGAGPPDELGLRCTVEDNGVGLTQAEQEGVLQPEEGPAILRAAQERAAQTHPLRWWTTPAQASPGGRGDTAAVGAGNPLEDAGLGVAALLAEAMGGSLGVFSAGPDRGSALWFRVALPTHEAGAEGRVATSTSASATESSTRRSSSRDAPAATWSATAGSGQDSDAGYGELDRHLGVNEATSDEEGSAVGSPFPVWASDVPTSPEPDSALPRGSNLSAQRTPPASEQPLLEVGPQMSASVAMGLTEEQEGSTPLMQASPCSSTQPGSTGGSVETRAPSEDGD